MNCRIWSAGRLLALLLVAATAGLLVSCRKDAVGSNNFAPITSDFDASGEGWTVSGDAEPSTWSATGGNPGGYISADDRAEGLSWFWIAPAKYRGDQSGAYGRQLMFDLRQSRVTSNYADDDVVLVGEELTLRYDLPSDPATAWTAYRVPLVEEGWINQQAGRAATRQEMESVLRSLRELRIRGEFFRGTDVGDLDNVVFGAPR